MTMDLVGDIFTKFPGRTFDVSATTRRNVVPTASTLVLLALLATVAWPHGAQATPTGAIWVSGGEIQDYAYEASSQVHSGFTTTTKHSGNAAFALHSGTISGQGRFQTPTWNSPVTNGTVYLSAWVYFSTNPCPLGCNLAFMIAAAGASNVALFKFNSATNGVTFFQGSTQIGSAYTITLNAWHLFEMKIGIDATATADDVAEARIDGAVRSSQTTSSVDTGTGAVDALRFLSPNLGTSIGGDVFVDDIIVTSDDYVGLDGHVIMRTADGPGFYGAGSSAVAFTGCSSYETCWSQVPPDNASYANDGTGSFAKFLATIGAFSTGTDSMTYLDTVFGCRGTWSIAKGPSGVNRNWEMLRRIGETGAETNMPSSGALPLTTTFSRWDDLECTLSNCGAWGYCGSDCTTDLDSVELGGFRNNSSQAKVMRIGDTYVSCGYRRSPSILLKTLSGSMDIGWRSGAHNQPVAESLARPVGLKNCTGTSQITCDLFGPANGHVLTVGPTNNGGVPSCIVTTATGDLSGSITYTGSVSSVDALTITLPQKVGIHTGISSATPCPTCSGANLGDSGTCQNGADAGEPCVVDGTYGSLGNTSTSCLPSNGTLIATMFPGVSSSSTGSQSLDATFTCTGSGAIGSCHCSGQEYANECDDQVCDADETCHGGGGPYCFPDPIVRDGSTSPLTVGAVGCIPATASSAVNSVLGLPGPIGISFELEVSPGS